MASLSGNTINANNEDGVVVGRQIALTARIVDRAETDASQVVGNRTIATSDGPCSASAPPGEGFPASLFRRLSRT